jgi:hypothetical protein
MNTVYISEGNVYHKPGKPGRTDCGIALVNSGLVEVALSRATVVGGRQCKRCYAYKVKK